MTRVQDEYTDYFAEFYDLMHQGAPEVPLVERLAAEHGGRILELGSGTGRLLLPLAERGLSVVGVDSSLDMLAVCRKKLACLEADARRRVELIEGNMSGRLPLPVFDIVLLACNTFLHATTHQAQVRLLESARRMLRPGGVCVLDVTLPTLDSMAKAHNRWETFVFYDPNREWMVIDRFRPHFDLRRQVERDDIHLTCVKSGKVVARLTTQTRLAIAFPREVFLAARSSGFQVRAAHADYAGRAWRPTKENGDLILLLDAPA